MNLGNEDGQVFHTRLSLDSRWFGSANSHWASLASRVTHGIVADLSACLLAMQGSTLLGARGNNPGLHL